MNKQSFMLSLLILLGSFTSFFAQEVKTTTDGQQLLQLSPGQQSAVDLFLKEHPDVQAASCPTTGPDASWCRTSYANWHFAVLGQNAKPQYQFAAWGDFRGKGQVDLAMPFHVRKLGNGPGANRGEIVVFEDVGAGKYKPVVAMTNNWGGCFDGMLFHPVRKRIEFWCNSMSGYVQWNGTTFAGKLMKGD